MSRVPHVAIYVRVSTKDQAEEGLSVDAQPANCLKKLDEVLGAGAYTYEIFRDLGKSGGLGPRPWATEIKGRERKGLWSMIQRLKAREFTHVSAFRGDRIYRDQLGALALYADVMKPRGIKFIYAAEEFDESLAGQLTSGILATIAEFQRKQIGENIEQTLAHRRSGGYYLGTTPFGWRRESREEQANERPNIVPVPEQGQVVVRIKDMYLSGISELAIAQQLNREGVAHKKSVGKWVAGTVNLVLVCPVHAGLVRITKDGQLGRGIHYEHRFYEEIEYRRIQERLSRNRKRLKGVAHTQPFRMFTGIAFCGHCGKPLRSSFHSTARGYRCLGDVATDDGAHVYIHADQLEELVVTELGQLSQDMQVQVSAEAEIERLVRSQDEVLKAEAQRFRKTLEELDKESDRVMAAVRAGAIPQMKAKKAFEEIELGQTDVQAKLLAVQARLNAASTRHELIRAAKTRLAAFPLLWHTMTDAERRECLHCVVERIDVHADEERKWMQVKLVTDEAPREIEILRGAERYRPRTLDGIASLTPRELAALKHVLDGADYVKIAGYWDSTPTNAHALLRRAASKLSASSPLAAAKMAELTIRRYEGQLPLFGRYNHPKTSSKRLMVSEMQVLELVAQGKEPNAVASLTSLHEDRIGELLTRALVKTGGASATEGWQAFEANPALLPMSMQNRKRIG